MELIANLKIHRESIAPVNIDVVLLGQQEITLEKADGVSPGLLGFFLPGNKVRWPRHPYNTSGNGYIVRDLTPLLESGKRYLPAFSLPFVGNHFVPRGQDFKKF